MIFRVHDDVCMVVLSFNLCFIVKIISNDGQIGYESRILKPRYHNGDQNGIHICELWTPYEMKHDPI